MIKKNLLLKELESVGDPLKKVELLSLLGSVRSCLRSLRKGEHKQKARRKRKQANNLLNKNPYLASKRVLDPRCMSIYLLIKILWISTSHLLYLILSIVFLCLPLMDFLLHYLFVNLLHQKIYLSVNFKKYLTPNEMVLLLEST